MAAKFWIIFWATVLLVGCKPPSNEPITATIDISSYYFPIYKLYDGMMFVYKYKEPNKPELIWHLQTKNQNKSVFLNKIVMESLSTQTIVEEVVPSGIKTVSLQTEDQTKENETITADFNILKGDTYPFKVEQNGGIYLFQAKWSNSNKPLETYTLIRNRRYEGDTTFVFKGQTIPAIKISVNELIEIDNDGVQEFKQKGLEVYAQGIGLVASRKVLDQFMVSEYQLVDTFPGRLLFDESN